MLTIFSWKTINSCLTFLSVCIFCVISRGIISCKFAQIYTYESMHIFTDLRIWINANMHGLMHMNQCKFAQIYAYESMQICTDACIFAQIYAYETMQIPYARIYAYESMQVCTDLCVWINANLHRSMLMNECNFANDVPHIWLISALLALEYINIYQRNKKRDVQTV